LNPDPIRIRIRNNAKKYAILKYTIFLQKFSRFLSQEGLGPGSGAADHTSGPGTRIHSATITRANGVRELLVCLGRDGDTGLVGLHLADVVELRHPVPRLHKPFLPKKSFNQSSNSLIKENIPDIVSLLRTENTMRKLKMLIYLPAA
jgi:hypothetical protein